MIRQQFKNEPTTYTLSNIQMILLILSTIQSFIQYLINQNKKIQESQDPQQNVIIINQKLKEKLTQIMISKNIKIREDRLNIFKRIFSIQQAVILQVVLRNQFVEENAQFLVSKKVKYFYVRLLEIFAWLETFKFKIINQKPGQSQQNIEKSIVKALKLLQKISEMQTQTLQKQRLSTFYLLKLLLQSNRIQLSVDTQFVKEWAEKKKSVLALNPKKQQNMQIKEIIENYIRKEERAAEKETIQKISKKRQQQLNSRQNRRIESIMREIQRSFKYKNMRLLRVVAQQINHYLDVFMTRFIRKVIQLAKISNYRFDSKVEGDQFRYYSQNSKNVYNLFKRPNTIIQMLQKYKEQELSKTCIKAIKLTYPSKLEQYFKLRNSQQIQQLNLYKSVSAIKQNKKLNAMQKYLFENEPQISDQIYQEEVLPPSKRLKITRNMVTELISQHYSWIFAAEAALYR